MYASFMYRRAEALDPCQLLKAFLIFATKQVRNCTVRSHASGVDIKMGLQVCQLVSLLIQTEIFQ